MLWVQQSASNVNCQARFLKPRFLTSNKYYYSNGVMLIQQQFRLQDRLGLGLQDPRDLLLSILYTHKIKKNPESMVKSFLDSPNTFSWILLWQVLCHVLHSGEDFILVPLDAGDLLSVPVRKRVAQSHLIKRRLCFVE